MIFVEPDDLDGSDVQALEETEVDDDSNNVKILKAMDDEEVLRNYLTQSIIKILF